ncbi:helix-turn-helix domain-containing protein [Paenibacillus sp. GXUN7292]|uniref:helix-turn-helix domain-containing protein n=1 Tax=Paenibacillus sp. GXUN7292 TaxID=3422499 RepID=UPI003D7DB9C7
MLSQIIQTASQRVRELRQLKELTHEQLATLAGVSRQFLKKFEDEQTNISIEKLNDIAVALGIHISDLLVENNHFSIEEKLIEQIKMLSRNKTSRDLKYVIALLNAMEQEESSLH